MRRAGEPFAGGKERRSQQGSKEEGELVGSWGFGELRWERVD